MRRAKLLVGTPVPTPPISRAVRSAAPRSAPIVKLLLDSGAFTVWNSGAEIDLKQYTGFLKRNAKHYWKGVSLDVIPGRPGSIRHRSDYIFAAERSYRNHCYMREQGLEPIPVYHQGEPITFLERYMKDGETYIGISPSDDMDKGEQKRWLDASFAAVTDSAGRPFVRTHGFGVANAAFIRRYPWSTLDSITWAYGVFRGRLFLPALDSKGNPDWHGETSSVFVVAPGYDGDNHPKYENLGRATRAQIDQYLEKHIGCTVARARYDTYWRRKVAIHYFEGISQAARFAPFQIIRSLLDVVGTGDHKAAATNAERRIVYATTNAWDRNLLLNDMHLPHRLLSYLYFTKNEEALAHYSATGKFPNDPDGRPKLAVPKRNVPWSVNYLNMRAIRTLDRIEALDKREDANESEP